MIVFSSDRCGPCLTVKNFLDYKGIEYVVVNADEPQHTETLIKITGRRLLPTTIIEGYPPIEGPDIPAIAKALRGL